MAESALQGQLEHGDGARFLSFPLASWLPGPASLDGRSFLEVLEYYAFREASGRLSLKGSGRARVLEIAPGRLHRFVLVDGDMEERAVRALVEAGAVSPEEAEAALKDAERDGQRLTYHLFARKRMGAGQIVRAFRRAQRDLLLALLDDAEGSFEFAPCEDFDAEADAVETDPRALFMGILRELLRRQDESHLRELLAPLGDAPLVVNDERLDAASWLYLRPAERQCAARQLGEGRTLAELAGSEQAPIEETLRVLALLVAARIVSVPDKALREEQDERVRAQAGEMQERLERLVAEKAAQNHFEALGLQWTCHPSDIVAAEKAARERFGPGARIRAIDGCEDGAERLWQRLSEAAALLAEEGQRGAYREQLLGRERVVAAAKFLAGKAEEVHREDRAKAIRLIECALDLDRQWDYEALRGKYARS